MLTYLITIEINNFQPYSKCLKLLQLNIYMNLKLKGFSKQVHKTFPPCFQKKHILKTVLNFIMPPKEKNISNCRNVNSARKIIKY